jgi:hypothetical protein
LPAALEIVEGAHHYHPFSLARKDRPVTLGLSRELIIIIHFLLYRRIDLSPWELLKQLIMIILLFCAGGWFNPGGPAHA